MSQEDILKFLKDQDDKTKYFSIPEIQKETGLGKQAHRQVNRLYAWGYLDIYVESYIPLRRKFRIKSE